MLDTFDILILIGRPASGKSEILDYLLHLDPQVRMERYHLRAPDVLDDFPLLWAWFEEDLILSRDLGRPRLHTDAEGYFLYPYLWQLLIRRLDLAYIKRRRDDPEYHRHTSTLFEFARGSEHGGYAAALPHFSTDVLTRAGIVYVNVSFAESLRKNRRRFNPDRPDSILEHSLPDEKMERLYGQDDWAALTAGDPDFVRIGAQRVPYAVFENEDDVTTNTPDRLADRLETVLADLYGRMQTREPLT
jgi:hypothetical protein